MNKIYQKTFPGAKTSANPQLSLLMQGVIAAVDRQSSNVVIAGMDRQSRNEEIPNKRTGSRVRARDDRQGQKGFTLIEPLLNKRHSRGMLSGISALISHAISRFYGWCLCFVNGKKAGDPRQKLSGMTALTVTVSHGFTLIELLVVVLIIGILAAVALPQYQKAVMRSRIAGAQVIVGAYKRVMEENRLARGGACTSNSIWLHINDWKGVIGYPNMECKVQGAAWCRIGDYLAFMGGDDCDVAVLYAPGSGLGEEAFEAGSIGAGWRSASQQAGCVASPSNEMAKQICKSITSKSYQGVCQIGCYGFYPMN